MISSQAAGNGAERRRSRRRRLKKPNTLVPSIGPASTGGPAPRGVLQHAIPCNLGVDLFEAQCADHLADRRVGIVGPEHPQVLPGLVVKTNPIAVLVSEELAIAQGGRPAEHGVAQVDLVDQRLAGGLDAGGDQSRWLVDRGIVPPAARDDEIAVLASPGGGLGRRRGRTWPDDDLRALVRQGLPAVVEYH